MRSSSTRQSVPTPRQSQVNTPTQLRTARRNSGALSPFCPSVSRIAWRTASGCRSARSRAADSQVPIAVPPSACSSPTRAVASARVRSSARAVPASGYTCRARWSPAITANATPSRSSAIAAAVACRAERIFSPPIDPETSTTMISSASAGAAGAGGGHGDDGVDARRPGGQVRVLVDLDGEGRCDGDLRGGHCSSWGGWTGRTATVTLSAPPAVSAAAASAAAAACGTAEGQRGQGDGGELAGSGQVLPQPVAAQQQRAGPGRGERDDLRFGVAVRAEPPGDGVGPERRRRPDPASPAAAAASAVWSAVSSRAGSAAPGPRASRPGCRPPSRP